MKIPRELIKELIASEEFKTTGDIMETIKSMFADVLNEVLETEIEDKPGHEKHERRNDEKPVNYRNGTPKRKLKTQLGKVKISVPRDRNGSEH